jgi:hypothetical protein
MSPFRETVVSRPRKHLWLAPPLTCTQRVFAYFPFKAHPMKSPTTFPSQGKNITPNKRVGCPRIFIRNCRLVQNKDMIENF